MANGKLYARRIILMLAFVVGVIFLLLYTKGCQANKHYADLTIEALSGQLKKSIDKNGVETAEKRLIMLEYKAMQKLHVSDSSDIGRLQKIINKKTISAAILKTSTGGTLTGKTNITYNIIDSMPCPMPVYADTLKDKWSEVAVTATKDSINLKYTIINEYEFIQEFKKEGRWPFKHTVPVVKVVVFPVAFK